MKGAVTSLSLTVILSSLSGGSILPNVTLDTDRRVYPARYQPELTGLNTRAYFRNERIVRFQAHCLFYGRPCDIVGRWAKPRMVKGFLGGCYKCTEEQSEWLENTLDAIDKRFPVLYRALIGRFLEYLEIKVPPAERKLIAGAFE